MKKVVLILSIATLLTPIWSLAAEQSSETYKDTCLLKSEHCTDQYSIQEIISKLNKEIDKGNKAYTDDEIQLLESKLLEYQKFMSNMLANP